MLICMATNSLFANNVTISDVALTNDSTITFKVSWDNSWRTNTAPNNHDAVWLFVKKRDCASLQWSHVNLKPTAASHNAVSPLEVYMDGRDGNVAGKGVFVRRAAAGSGNIAPTLVTLSFAGIGTGEYDFKVFGIEMVQIPQASFQLGDGVSAFTFRQGSAASAAPTNPFTVVSEAAITYGSGATNIHAITNSSYYPSSLPAAFPKGFKEIYCMKYEISQGQYVDFVNTLLSDQAAARQIVSAASRLNISGTWPVLVTTMPHRAMINLSWADLQAYLDWSALRPMTELEYEKICRGPVNAVQNEYPWGTSIITQAATLVNDGTATESVSDAITAGGGIANFGTAGVPGVMRVGFAAKPGTNRLTAGATYYGVMDMAGNAWEMVVHTTSTAGVAFTGNLGDGELALTPSPGVHNVAGWPANTGKGLRGGAFDTVNTTLRVSDRSSINVTSADRTINVGGRGVR